MKVSIKKIIAEAGFTTMELLVAGVITAILSTSIYAAYHFSLKQQKKWERRTHLERSVNLSFNRLMRDLQIASDLVIKESGEIDIETHDRLIRYSLRDSLLYRNGAPVNDKHSRISTFYVGWEADQRKNGVFIRDRDDQQTDRFNSLVEVRMSFTSPSRTIHLKSAVLPRNIKSDESKILQ